MLNNVPLLILLAAFGPYLFGVARVDQIMIYPLAIVAVMTLCLRPRAVILFSPIVFSILLLLLSVSIYTLLVTLLGDRHYESTIKALSHFENYVQPIGVVLIMGAFVRTKSETEAITLLRRVYSLLLTLLCLNSLLALLSVFIDVSPVIRYFTGPVDSYDLSTSAQAATMGRYSGIFNQPVESGLSYSLGLFSWAHLNHTKRRTGTSDYLVLWLLLLGGVLSVSKAFILIGVPLFIVYWLSGKRLFDFKRLGHLANGRFIFAAVLGSCGSALVFSSWSGLSFLARLFRPTEAINLLSLYTGLRFGRNTSHVKDVLARGWTEGFPFGLGFGAEITLDNAYAGYFIQSGPAGLIVYGLVLACIGWLGLKEYRKGSEEGRLLIVIWVLIVCAGIGSPVLTINRFGPVFWVVFMLLYGIIHLRGRSAYNLGNVKDELPPHRLDSF